MAKTGRDPYEVLGVARSASDAEVRAAYRRLVQLHHPDHNAGSAQAARRFAEVQEAYTQVQRLRAQTGSARAATGGAAAPRAATPGQTSPRTAQTSPRTGQTSPRTGQTSPRTGQTSPRTGQTPPRTGQTPPRTGRTPPRTGQTPPRTGQPRTATAHRVGSQPAGGQAGDLDVNARMAELERELRAAQLARERARSAARAAAAASAASGSETDGSAGPSSRAGRPSDEELGYYTTDDSFAKILADARSELTGLYGHARQQPIVKRVGDLIDELADKLTGGR